MTMLVQAGVERATVDNFCKTASRLALSQVVDAITVKERLTLNGEARRTEFAVTVAFFPEHEYEEEYGVESSEILASFGFKFPLLLKREIIMEMRKLDANLKSQIAELGKGKKMANPKNGAGVGDDGDDEGDDGDDQGDDEVPSRSLGDGGDGEVGDGDAEDAKRARQKTQQATYGEDDEEVGEEALEEYDNAAIEAEFVPEEGGIVAETQQVLESGSADIASLFMQHLPLAEDFSFTPSACTFRVEVRFLTVALLLTFTPAPWSVVFW
jgi:hypothetical protein